MFGELYEAELQWAVAARVAAEWDREGAQLLRQTQLQKKKLQDRTLDQETRAKITAWLEKRDLNKIAPEVYPLLSFRIYAKVFSVAHKKVLLDRIDAEIIFLRKELAKKNTNFKEEDSTGLELLRSLVKEAEIGKSLSS